MVKRERSGRSETGAEMWRTLLRVQFGAVSDNRKVSPKIRE